MADLKSKVERTYTLHISEEEALALMAATGNFTQTQLQAAGVSPKQCELLQDIYDLLNCRKEEDQDGN